MHVKIALPAVIFLLLADVACSGEAAKPPATGTAALPAGALYDSDDTAIVKKSRNGVCHAASSPSFGQTIHYTAFRTMRDCLQSGGKEAK